MKGMTKSAVFVSSLVLHLLHGGPFTIGLADGAFRGRR
jgi:hypothetical protein